MNELAALGPELDRSRDAGKSHDLDLDPGHFADVGDDGKIAGVVALAALPASRRDYDTALRTAGADEYRVGYLPYALIDGWQQIAKDFAIWRIDRVGERLAANAETHGRFTSDRELREALTLRDIGVWSHYVADASQPLHVSVHYNGWGDYPNPRGFSTSHDVHAKFESDFVRDHSTLAGVMAHMRPMRLDADPIGQQVGAYLAATAARVMPLYELEKSGDFARGSPAAVDFVEARLADGATELRDLVVDAYAASATLRSAIQIPSRRPRPRVARSRFPRIG